MTFDYTGKLDSDGFFIQEADVHAWCKAMDITNYSYAYSDFHQAMALSVKYYSFDLTGKLDQLSQLPVRFDKVEGGLWLEHNQLTSLVGLPQTSKLIMLANNPLSFQALMPLSRVEKLEKLYLPIEFKKELEAKGIEFRQETSYGQKPSYVVIEKKDTHEFLSLLRKIVQQQKNEKVLQQNQSFLLALNQAFQQKILFKGKIKYEKSD